VKKVSGIGGQFCRKIAKERPKLLNQRYQIWLLLVQELAVLPTFRQLSGAKDLEKVV
jgi:hypothetical protein